MWDSLVFDSWNPWSPKNEIPFRSTNEWRGHGEERFAEELRLQGRPARLTGLNEESFDVLEEDGSRWEVKEISSKGFRIRPGKNGIAAAKFLVRTIADLVEGLRTTYSLVFSDALGRASLESMGVNVAADLSFLDEALQKIGEGSISRGMIHGGTSQNRVGLIDVLRSLKASRSVPRSRSGEATFSFNEMGCSLSSRLQIAYEDFIFKLRASGLPVPEFIPSLDLFFSGLWDPRVKSFVDDPDSFVSLWERSSTVESAFSGVTGIVIVHETDGYAVTRLSDAHRVMCFDNVSQGRAMFKLIRRTQSEPILSSTILECEEIGSATSVCPVELNRDVGNVVTEGRSHAA